MMWQSAGEILTPWMKQLNERRERMEKEGQEGGTLPGMAGGGVPLEEENTTRVIGRLTRNPLMVEVTGGRKKAVFTLDVPRTYQSKGQAHQGKSFVPVAAWHALAAQVEPLGKDSAVLVTGYLRTWADPKDKSPRWELEAQELQVLERRAPMQAATAA
jgi:hypothetical protein